MAAYVPAALRRQVRERAGERCEYCLIPEAAVLAAHEIDHIIPEKHGRTTDEGNLAFSCALCNKFKGSDLASVDPETGDIVSLYHPRKDRWAEHFQLRAAELVPLTPTGRATIRGLRLNDSARVEERRLLTMARMYLPPG